MSITVRIVVAIVLTATPTAAARGEDLFADRVAPVLQARCLSCHNTIDAKGGFSLQTAKELRASGFVEPGAPAESHLLSVLVGSDGEPPEMPKDTTPLNNDEIAAIRKWIAEGAQWPEAVSLSEPVVDNFDWWSLKPVKRPPVPVFPDEQARSWAKTPIDAFILKRLRENKLRPSRQADRRTLIRRVTYDLTGLPPTPEEVAAFINDTAPGAWGRLVDRLLESPHYGERWARHWLDVARYADTCGYDKDKLRPNAWPYRDYVVRSFNADKPYSRFVQEQIAGDVLFPKDPDGILGLGFIAAGPWDFIGHVEVPETKIDGKEARNLDRDEMVSGTLNTFCSATVQCARCHNHKFDPITQEHYYSLQAVFAAVDRADRSYDVDPEVEKTRARLNASLDQLRKQRQTLSAETDKAAGPRLPELRKRIAELKKQATLEAKRPEYGYHSGIVREPETEKWVQIDLGQAVPVTSIVLHACHDEYAQIGAGFGFPVRFRITAAMTEKALTESPTVVKATKDFANPRLAPVEIRPEAPLSARFVRVTATRLVERKNDYIFALAELEVFGADGTNVAEGARVSSLDSIEAPVRWRRTNLVDGIWPRAGDPKAAQELAGAETALAELLAQVNTPERAARAKSLDEQIASKQKSLAELPKGRMVYAAASNFKTQGNFKATGGKPRPIRVLHRGNIRQPGQDVTPGTIPLSHDADWRFRLNPEASEGERRAALARWIVDRRNPLTWRSIVNRVWQYHFGRGIVDTPNDFGRMGQPPSHPELLDWLATEFRDNGQRFRALHRLIVMSSVYQQQSGSNPEFAKVDGDNRLLWRMNRRRLEAEELRDSVLSVSGKLNRTMGGPGYYLFELQKTAHSPHYEYHLFDPEDPASHRRSLYRFIVRSQPDPFMTTLDCADSSQSTPRRTRTLTSLQALSLLNNRFMLTMAKHFAARLQAHREVSDQVTAALQLIAGRNPTDEELSHLTEYCREHGAENLCRVLFNLSEFVYVD